MKEELTNLMHTFEALGPLVGHAVKSGQLLEPRCELTVRRRQPTKANQCLS